MKCLTSAMLSVGLLLTGCVAPIGPVEVTRFHAPEVAAQAKGPIAVEPATGMDGNSLEWRAYQAAVERQLAALGYAEGAAGSSAQVAELRLSRSTIDPVRSSGPVSVGIGGSTGSYGSGLGLGIGINLSPKPAQQVQTLLAVTIRDRATKAALWEGRAAFSVRATSPMADTALAAPKMAEALFKDFPGQSGETILVK
ncbi:DUF4136 domain-containing protein [Novosphingobium sp. B 225]|uniref:DUF4136 domain-containing protein n=1 Tax=Novosphingobium sp. B 225 TaxID=1961849 RepID=UPI000B4A925B|nr:DUF4136 domain-containing protein [Novosphingobium sp. B 225]